MGGWKVMDTDEFVYLSTCVKGKFMSTTGVDPAVVSIVKLDDTQVTFRIIGYNKGGAEVTRRITIDRNVFPKHD